MSKQLKKKKFKYLIAYKLGKKTYSCVYITKISKVSERLINEFESQTMEVYHLDWSGYGGGGGVYEMNPQVLSITKLT